MSSHSHPSVLRLSLNSCLQTQALLASALFRSPESRASYLQFLHKMNLWALAQSEFLPSCVGMLQKSEDSTTVITDFQLIPIFALLHTPTLHYCQCPRVCSPLGALGDSLSSFLLVSPSACSLVGSFFSNKLVVIPPCVFHIQKHAAISLVHICLLCHSICSCELCLLLLPFQWYLGKEKR